MREPRPLGPNILGSKWRHRTTGEVVEVNGWAFPACDCSLTNGKTIKLNALRAAYDETDR